jgi:hypothetical protein
MSADWVAASVRARSMAKRRVGAGASRTIASERCLADGLARLADSVYAARLVGCTTLAAAERATRDTVLWQLRVLAGWVPASGTRLIRAAAGAFERDNILALADGISTRRPTAAPFELGALATAWTRLREATSLDELVAGLRRSAWGDCGSQDTTALRDVLTIVWLRRLAEAASAARPWTEAMCTLTVARILLVDRAVPSPRIIQLVRPLIGENWQHAHDLAALQASLPRSTHALFRGILSPADLWHAETGLRMTCEADGFRLLRTSVPGPDVVLGGIAVLAMDAWRVRAALATAAAGSGPSEVLDVVA